MTNLSLAPPSIAAGRLLGNMGFNLLCRMAGLGLRPSQVDGDWWACLPHGSSFVNRKASEF